MRCLDPVLWLATRSTGCAWRSVSHRFFFRFVSPRPVLLFHSFRTISLRFGKSRLLWRLACLSFSPIYPSSPLPVSLIGSRSGLLLSSRLPVQADFRGLQKHEMSAPVQLALRRAFTRMSVGSKKTSCLRVNAGQEERPKRTLRGSKLHLLFIFPSTFATKAFISGNATTRERGRVIREEGLETVLSTLYIGLLLAVDYKYRRQETTKKRRQFPVGSVVSTGVNPDGHNAAGNWQTSPLRPQVV